MTQFHRFTISLLLACAGSAAGAQATPDLAALRKLIDGNRFVEAKVLMQPLLVKDQASTAERELVYDWLVLSDDLQALDRLSQQRLAGGAEAIDHIAAGRLAVERKDFEAAKRQFLRARELSAASAPLDARALRGLAAVAYQQRQYEASLKHLQEARGKDATPDLLMALNETLIRLGRTNEAVAAADEAFRLNPDHEQANYQLGNGYTRTNYTDLAKRCGAGFGQAQALTRTASDAFEQQALDQAKQAAHAALAACTGYGRAHAVLAKVAEFQRLAVDVHKDAEERRFQALAMPQIPGIERYVLNWAQLSERHKKRVALSIAPWKAYVPVLVAGGASHFIKPLYMRLSETPGVQLLKDRRIDYDSRLWDDVRGVGGHATVTGIEDVERSVYGRYNTVLHELSHQVHGVLGTADKKQIQELYAQAKARDAQSGQAFLSRYAGGSEWEYFAEGANSQDTPRRDAYDFREIVRERLIDKDLPLQALVLKLEAATDVSASLAASLVNAAYKHVSAGELPQVFAKLDEALKASPKDEQVWSARLHAFGLKGDRKGVEAAGKRALALFPNSGSLRSSYVDALWHSGAALAPQLASLETMRARLDAADRFDLDNELGRYALHLGRAPRALAAFDAALAYQAGSPEALWGRASALALERRWDEAVETYEKAIKIRTGTLALRLDFVRDLLIAGRTERARRELEEAATLGPADAQLLALRGWLALLDQQPDRALELTATALEKAPWCDTAVLVKATALRLKASRDEARESVQLMAALNKRLVPGASPRHVYRADSSSWTSVNLASETWRRSLASLQALKP
ncbi:tetratricopeptide repeat protein [Pelomonas sp. SE-A7]|uniref:tetratricopeptide repeat protein n=1 Tax=Pelomonas sp. SE-A7 TaxID=3054953 RepID=UPI00259CFF4D|nr:tetratricopeptide repeat protein [Pelomonas sp. SE-A7]MDM4766639.1 tetratricopeptide repeat protein [Pelomonas sp. SE-A7]